MQTLDIVKENTQKGKWKRDSCKLRVRGYKKEVSLFPSNYVGTNLNNGNNQCSLFPPPPPCSKFLA